MPITLSFKDLGFFEKRKQVEWNSWDQDNLCELSCNFYVFFISKLLATGKVFILLPSTLSTSVVIPSTIRRCRISCSSSLHRQTSDIQYLIIFEPTDGIIDHLFYEVFEPDTGTIFFYILDLQQRNTVFWKRLVQSRGESSRFTQKGERFSLIWFLQLNAHPVRSLSGNQK